MLFSELGVDQTILIKEGNLNIPMKGIAYDSRQVKQGFVFVAIEGFKTDGHYFIEQAISRGAVALVVQKPVAVPPHIAWIQVPDSRLALALMAARFYGFPSLRLKLIGVTGTNGKTTTTYLLKEIYREAGQKVGLIGTIHNLINDRVLPVQHTTPESLDLQRLLAKMVTEGIQTVIMEVSSHALTLHRVAGCYFNTGLFTNISQDHLDFHKDMEDYLKAKMLLFKMAGKLSVINYDDPSAQKFVAASKGRVVTYGINNKAQVRAKNVEVKSGGVSFYVQTPWGETQVNLKLTGYFNVYNALAALAAGGADGLPLLLMVKALESVPYVRGRFEVIDKGQDFTVIVDYAHTPDGLENVLKTARQITNGRLITVFGCGGDRDQGKRPVMGEIAAKYSEIPVITSDNPRTEDPLKIIADIEKGVRKVLNPGKYTIIPDRRQAIYFAICAARQGDIVIIAGKGHENYQIIGNDKFPFDDREEAIKVLENNILGKLA